LKILDIGKNPDSQTRKNKKEKRKIILIWVLSDGWKADLGNKILEKKSGGQHTPFPIPIRVGKKA
jgi:hypothetical protein